jgi:L-lactate dehydrogenase complex protein LldE
MKIALFPTCVVDAIDPDAGLSAVRVLRRMGHEVTVPDRATCCGQPAWNSGEAEAAATVARTTLDALDADPADVVVVPAGSCTTMMRVFWPELFELVGDHASADKARRLHARVKEFSEFVDAAGAPPASGGAGSSVLYHHSCHMLRELRIKDQPEHLLDHAGAPRVPNPAEGKCCGFGGLFSVKLPETSAAMADEVLDAAVSAQAAEVVGCDASCLMQLRTRAGHRDLPLRFRHLAEVLDEATR